MKIQNKNWYTTFLTTIFDIIMQRDGDQAMHCRIRKLLFANILHIFESRVWLQRGHEELFRIP